MADLPAEWNRRYRDMLGVTPSNDSEGCLQDVHWSEGLFGYFPSYLLGHLISAQLCQAMASEIGAPEDHVANGDITPLLGWLRQHVHPVGRALNAEDLVRQVTGRPLDSTAFLQHVRGKVQALQPA